MDTNSYVAFLIIGTVLVLIDGQIIYRNGRRFLQHATPNAPSSSLAKLVTVLFHLGTLGVLALISTIDVPADNQTESVVIRLGVMLLIIGLAHWIAVSALSRIRDREAYEEIDQQRRHGYDRATRAAGTHVPEPTDSPAYTGESATDVVNRQHPQR